MYNVMLLRLIASGQNSRVITNHQAESKPGTTMGEEAGRGGTPETKRYDSWGGVSLSFREGMALGAWQVDGFAATNFRWLRDDERDDGLTF